MFILENLETWETIRKKKRGFLFIHEWWWQSNAGFLHNSSRLWQISGFLGWNSNLQTWWQACLSTEPSRWPHSLLSFDFKLNIVRNELPHGAYSEIGSLLYQYLWTSWIEFPCCFCPRKHWKSLMCPLPQWVINLSYSFMFGLCLFELHTHQDMNPLCSVIRTLLLLGTWSFLCGLEEKKKHPVSLLLIKLGLHPYDLSWP